MAASQLGLGLGLGLGLELGFKPQHYRAHDVRPAAPLSLVRSAGRGGRVRVRVRIRVRVRVRDSNGRSSVTSQGTDTVEAWTRLLWGHSCVRLPSCTLALVSSVG